MRKVLYWKILAENVSGEVGIMSPEASQPPEPYTRPSHGCPACGLTP